jgi:thiol-disulfide isomerase/thioredoxin
MVNGRNGKGPEPNAPNTLGGTCIDGTSGGYHTTESLDRLRISTLDGLPMAAGKPILIEVHAPWCPICKAQAPILAKLGSDARFKNLVSFNVDFDSQKDLLKKFNVQKQSTLIVFKGKQEAGRSTGDTSAASIEALLAKSI